MQYPTSDIQLESKPTVNPIEKALEQALNQGPAAIDQQIRCILAHSQMLGQRTPGEVYRERPLPAAYARLELLVDFAPHITAGQVETLYHDLSQINDTGVRLLLQSRLAKFLSTEQQVALIRDAWKVINTIEDLPQRTRILFQLAHLDVPPQDASNRPGIVTEMFRFARSIGNPEGRIRSLTALAVYAPPAAAKRLYERVLAELAKIRNDGLRSTTISSLATRIPNELEADIIAGALAIRAPVARARALTALAQALPDRIELVNLAAEAIAVISEEDERIEALTVFVPCLFGQKDHGEYPQALTAALGIAVDFTRRPLRARALVALAPYLTPDLQQEALAAVHALPNERERATLLGELAPHLPSNMLVASLAVAHSMREQDARVHALSILAHYLPDNQARAQTMLDALAAASNLHNPFERVRALIGLADVLPSHLQDQAYTNAVEATRLIENENARARALSLLGQHLPPTLLPRILDAAYELKDTQQRTNALSTIATRLQPSEQNIPVAHVLEAAAKLPFAYQRARAIISIAPCLTPELMPKAFELAHGITEPHDQASALIALVQRLPPSERVGVIQEAWELIAKIDDGYDRASALVAISPMLPSTLRPELEQHMGMVVGAIMDDYDQASAISLLAPLLTDAIPARESDSLPSTDLLVTQGVFTALSIPYQAARAAVLSESISLWLKLDDSRRYALWREATQRLKSLPLADVLLCLSVLMPVIRVVAGDQYLPKVAQVLGVQHEKTKG